MPPKKTSVSVCSVVGCRNRNRELTIHKLTSNEEKRSEWISFIYNGDVPADIPKTLYVCCLHFTTDSYSNYGQHKAGLSELLHLNHGSVPTIRDGDAEEDRTGFFDHKATQTYTSVRKYGTQLSMGTLSARVCSTKTQTPVPTLRTVGTQTPAKFPVHKMSSSHIKGPGVRPAKRRHVESEEEEGFTLPESQVEPDHSTFNPGESQRTKHSATSIDSRPAYNDKKYIVFESCLRELFDTCPVCERECEMQQQQKDTFVAFNQICEECEYSRQWQSQPLIKDIPVGNVQFSAATYFSGASFVQLEKLCKALQLQICQYDTFQKHAREYLEPAIIHMWKNDQQSLFSELKQEGKVALAGDVRTDSPGDSATFGSYSVMHLESNKVLDLQLIQNIEVGGSGHMEKEGLKRSLDLLHSSGLAVEYMVTDRHPQTQKLLQELNITQFYDVWDFEKDLSEKLQKPAKTEDCVKLRKWQRAIENHVYYRSVALNKVEKILTNKRLLKDLERLNHNQTSSEESFHSLVLRFAPEKAVFPHIGMLCRLYLATMDHNENTNREQATTTSGKPVYQMYPTSKKGEASAKPVKTDPTFNYIAHLMRLVFEEVMEDPESFAEDMKKIPIPVTL